jgi:hypothetical protein
MEETKRSQGGRSRKHAFSNVHLVMEETTGSQGGRSRKHAFSKVGLVMEETAGSQGGRSRKHAVSNVGLVIVTYTTCGVVCVTNNHVECSSCCWPAADVGGHSCEYHAGGPPSLPHARLLAAPCRGVSRTVDRWAVGALFRITSLLG